MSWRFVGQTVAWSGRFRGGTVRGRGRNLSGLGSQGRRDYRYVGDRPCTADGRARTGCGRDGYPAARDRHVCTTAYRNPARRIATTQWATAKASEDYSIQFHLQNLTAGQRHFYSVEYRLADNGPAKRSATVLLHHRSARPMCERPSRSRSPPARTTAAKETYRHMAAQRAGLPGVHRRQRLLRRSAQGTGCARCL